MSRVCVSCLALLAVAVPAVPQSQKPDRTAMYEDVEVMRRLLGNAFAQAHPRPNWVSVYPQLGAANLAQTRLNFNNARFNQPGARYVDPYGLGNYPMTLDPYGGINTIVNDPLSYPNTVAATWGMSVVDRPAPPATGGTYLKGLGPVFDVTMDYAEAAGLKAPVRSAALAANCARCHGTAMDQKAKATPAAAKKEAADPWDVELRHLRGDKEPEAPAAPATRLGPNEVCVPGKLTEVILDSLTRYGHRFRELAADERIAVVVTLKGGPKSARSDPPSNDPAAQVKVQADEQLALADMHAKQGKTDEAVKAYQKAVELLSKPLRFADTTRHEQATRVVDEATKTLRSAHNKIAQNLLAAGKLDEAKAAIESAKTATIHIEGGAKAPAAPEKPPLPIKLTVTLSKKAIDDHRAGKVNAFDLRTAAEVEAVGFPKAEKKP
jgi:hypothetical protein